MNHDVLHYGSTTHMSNGEMSIPCSQSNHLSTSTHTLRQWRKKDVLLGTTTTGATNGNHNNQTPSPNQPASTSPGPPSAFHQQQQQQHGPGSTQVPAATDVHSMADSGGQTAASGQIARVAPHNHYPRGTGGAGGSSAQQQPPADQPQQHGQQLNQQHQQLYVPGVGTAAAVAAAHAAASVARAAYHHPHQYATHQMYGSGAVGHHPTATDYSYSPYKDPTSTLQHLQVPQHQPQQPTPVKYSEIVEPPNHSSASSINSKPHQQQSTKDQQLLASTKEYQQQLQQDMCSSTMQQGQQMLQNQQQYNPAMMKHHQYLSQNPHPLSQYYKHASVHPQYHQRYPTEANNYLADLNKIAPQMAQSIMNDPHLRDPNQMYQASQGVFEAQRGSTYSSAASFQQQQRLYAAARPASSTYNQKPPTGLYPPTNPIPRGYQLKSQSSTIDSYRNMHLYQGNPTVPKYPPQPDYSKQMHLMDFSRRQYPDSMHQLNYALPSKMSPTSYSQCAQQQFEYSHHYQQNRHAVPTVPSEYHQMAVKNAAYLHHEHQQLQMPDLVRDNTPKSSNSLKQYLESWNDEDLGGTADDSGVPVSSASLDLAEKPLIKITRTGEGNENIYVLDSTNIPTETVSQYLQHVPQIDKLPDNIKFYPEIGKVVEKYEQYCHNSMEGILNLASNSIKAGSTTDYSPPSCLRTEEPLNIRPVLEESTSKAPQPFLSLPIIDGEEPNVAVRVEDPLLASTGTKDDEPSVLSNCVASPGSSSEKSSPELNFDCAGGGSVIVPNIAATQKIEIPKIEETSPIDDDINSANSSANNSPKIELFDSEIVPKGDLNEEVVPSPTKSIDETMDLSVSVTKDDGESVVPVKIENNVINLSNQTCSKAADFAINLSRQGSHENVKEVVQDVEKDTTKFVELDEAKNSLESKIITEELVSENVAKEEDILENIKSTKELDEDKVEIEIPPTDSNLAEDNHTKSDHVEKTDGEENLIGDSKELEVEILNETKNLEGNNKIEEGDNQTEETESVESKIVPEVVEKEEGDSVELAENLSVHQNLAKDDTSMDSNEESVENNSLNEENEIKEITPMEEDDIAEETKKDLVEEVEEAIKKNVDKMEESSKTEVVSSNEEKSVEIIEETLDREEEEDKDEEEDKNIPIVEEAKMEEEEKSLDMPQNEIADETSTKIIDSNVEIAGASSDEAKLLCDDTSKNEELPEERNDKVDLPLNEVPTIEKVEETKEINSDPEEIEAANEEPPQEIQEEIDDGLNILRILQSNIILQIADELIQINVINTNDRKIISVIALSDCTVVTENNNNEEQVNVQALDEPQENLIQELPEENPENSTQDKDADIPSAKPEVIQENDLQELSKQLDNDEDDEDVKINEERDLDDPEPRLIQENDPNPKITLPEVKVAEEAEDPLAEEVGKRPDSALDNLETMLEADMVPVIDFTEEVNVQNEIIIGPEESQESINQEILLMTCSNNEEQLEGVVETKSVEIDTDNLDAHQKESIPNIEETSEDAKQNDGASKTDLDHIVNNDDAATEENPQIDNLKLEELKEDKVSEEMVDDSKPDLAEEKPKNLPNENFDKNDEAEEICSEKDVCLETTQNSLEDTNLEPPILEEQVRIVTKASVKLMSEDILEDLKTTLQESAALKDDFKEVSKEMLKNDKTELNDHKNSIKKRRSNSNEILDTDEAVEKIKVLEVPEENVAEKLLEATENCSSNIEVSPSTKLAKNIELLKTPERPKIPGVDKLKTKFVIPKKCSPATSTNSPSPKQSKPAKVKKPKLVSFSTIVDEIKDRAQARDRKLTNNATTFSITKKSSMKKRETRSLSESQPKKFAEVATNTNNRRHSIANETKIIGSPKRVTTKIVTETVVKKLTTPKSVEEEPKIEKKFLRQKPLEIIIAKINKDAKKVSSSKAIAKPPEIPPLPKKIVTKPLVDTPKIVPQETSTNKTMEIKIPGIEPLPKTIPDSELVFKKENTSPKKYTKVKVFKTRVNSLDSDLLSKSPSQQKSPEVKVKTKAELKEAIHFEIKDEPAVLHIESIISEKINQESKEKFLNASPPNVLQTIINNVVIPKPNADLVSVEKDMVEFRERQNSSEDDTNRKRLSLKEYNSRKRKISCSTDSPMSLDTSSINSIDSPLQNLNPEPPEDDLPPPAKLPSIDNSSEPTIPFVSRMETSPKAEDMNLAAPSTPNIMCRTPQSCRSTSSNNTDDYPLMETIELQLLKSRIPNRSIEDQKELIAKKLEDLLVTIPIGQRSDNLINRFLNREQLTSEETIRVKEIIKFKRDKEEFLKESQSNSIISGLGIKPLESYRKLNFDIASDISIPRQMDDTKPFGEVPKTVDTVTPRSLGNYKKLNFDIASDISIPIQSEPFAIEKSPIKVLTVVKKSDVINSEPVFKRLQEELLNKCSTTVNKLSKPITKINRPSDIKVQIKPSFLSSTTADGKDTIQDNGDSVYEISSSTTESTNTNNRRNSSPTDELKIHLRKVQPSESFTPTRKRKRKRFRNLYSADTESSDETTSSNSTNNSPAVKMPVVNCSTEENSGYSVFCSGTMTGLPKIIIKRTNSESAKVTSTVISEESQSGFLGMQPVVRLVRNPRLDNLAKRKRKG